MHPEDDIEVAVSYWRTGASPTYESKPIEMGARGEVVSILGVHYSLDYLVSGVLGYRYIALSSNPGHELTPPSTQDLFFGDKAFYAFASFINVFKVTGDHYGLNDHFFSIFVPLYGMVRPRRQIICIGNLVGNEQFRLRTEVYYRPVHLGQPDLVTINRKFGKYRRS